MDENQMREARTRAAIRVARRLGADTDQLHDVMIAVRTGWTVAAETGGTLHDALPAACDQVWKESGEPYAPVRSRRMLWVLAAMWPDVLLDCAREEEQVRVERLRQAERADERIPTTEGYAKLAQHFEQRGEVDRAKTYREAAAVMAWVPR
jgi:hypothetical protein